jgi:hypothetical protein
MLKTLQPAYYLSTCQVLRESLLEAELSHVNIKVYNILVSEIILVLQNYIIM